MAGTVTVPPHQFLNLPLLHHEVSSSSLSEKEPTDPTYLTFHRTCTANADVNSTPLIQKDGIETPASSSSSSAILQISVGHSSNALRAFELLRSTQTNAMNVAIALPLSLPLSRRLQLY